MEFKWRDEQLEFRDSVLRFAETLNEGLNHRDQAGIFPRDLWQRCADFGLQSIAVPSTYNSSGVDTDLMTATLAIEALGRGCRDNGLNLALATQMWTVQHPIVEFGTQDQKQRYLPGLCRGEMIGAHAVTEPDAGSDHLALTTHAKAVEGGYEVTGTKRFITLAPVADVVLTFATVDPSEGRWGLTALLVETNADGCEIQSMPDKMGLRTVPMGEILFDQCFVPSSNRLGPEGAGASISSSSLAIERTFILASQVGTMERQFQEALAFARTRRQFGRPVGKFQSVSNRIADMKLSLETARLLLYQVAWMLTEGHQPTMEAALLKLHISESFVASSLDAVRTYGGAGYLVDNDVERDLRDAVGGLLYAGTNDIQRVLIARMLDL